MEREQDDFIEDEGADSLYKPFSYKSCIDRYYNKYYVHFDKADPTLEAKDKALLEEGANLDQYVFMHSNKISLVGISKQHSAAAQDKPIKEICLREYADKKMTGKRKPSIKDGAIMVDEKTALGDVYMEDGKVYKIRAMIKGKLLEMNEAVAKNPDLLKSSPEKNGYVAVIQPLQSEPERIDKTFIKSENY